MQKKHEKVMLTTAELLDIYTMNLGSLSRAYACIIRKPEFFDMILYRDVEESKEKLVVQNKMIVLMNNNIIKARLMHITPEIEQGSTRLPAENVFRLIKIYNISIDKMQVMFEKPPLEDITSSNNMLDKKIEPDVKSKRKSSKALPSNQDHEIVKLRVPWFPESIFSHKNYYTIFTASKILKIIAKTQCSKVAEIIANTLISRIDVPSSNSNKIVPPWKKKTTLNMNEKNVKNNLDIFEEAYEREEDENRLNQRKLDFALQQEFGENFPGVYKISIWMEYFLLLTFLA